MTRLANPIASAAIARPGHISVRTTSGALQASEAELYIRAAAHELLRQGVKPGQWVTLASGTQLLHWWLGLHAIHWVGAGAILGTKAAGKQECLTFKPTAGTFETPPTSSPAHTFALTDPIVQLCSSGSTSTVGRYRLTAGQLYFSAMSSATRLGVLPSDSWLACLPLEHVGGLSVVMRSVLYGTTAVLHERFSPTTTNTLIDNGDISQVSLVPAMLARLLDARGNCPCPPTFRFILLGGGPSHPDRVAQARDLGFRVQRTWGMTEAASQVATETVEAGPAAPHYVGPPLAHYRVEIKDGRLCATDVANDITLVTNDTGRVDTSNHIWVSGRADRVVTVGGANLDLGQLEATLQRTIPSAVVNAIRHPDWEHTPFAVVHVEKELPEVNLPPTIRHWILWPDPLTNAMGKVAHTVRQRTSALAAQLFDGKTTRTVYVADPRDRERASKLFPNHHILAIPKEIL